MSDEHIYTGKRCWHLEGKEKRVAFIRELPFWSGRIISKNLANFTIIGSLFTGNCKDMPVRVLEEVMNYLEVLSSNYEVYFSDNNNFGTESSTLIKKKIYLLWCVSVESQQWSNHRGFNWILRRPEETVWI